VVVADVDADLATTVARELGGLGVGRRTVAAPGSRRP
jgi:hypothetical protein